jgi:acetolactate synthase-1/3 small subunit|uniref:Acetolactate synthase small subunit n=1 Tax=Cerataulina bicornis TaxID=1527800 RepID=A0A089VKA5_CERBC|nr:acetohydroxyacid synthetase small subunit [Cerataulina daemon]AIR76072.1 acetohydroxyacid synthetase small subunit [Cerataulina daemon]
MELTYEYECLLSILVENQPSILTRLVGLLTRRGFVIESLVVGPTEYDSLSRIIIVLPGNLRIIDQVTRQLYKLFPVVKVYNLTHIPSITRELIFFKILANQSERQKILEITKIFNATVVDCTNKTITIEVTGDSEKIVALEQMINQFGILEKIRTGKIGISKESIVGSQLYTVHRDRLRRKIINTHVVELENKMYL